ncbi:AN1-type zinc finger protein 6 [Drosophila guanche]|uniref:Blast:AN1-type zinc finger protein 6 n=1 Tax=Drosophila guanche TaxID=7266 RepID=A0A3B0KJ43_DROGU|nr:AN1-type zinc finger protein 6 [Drosophila guanche]SPP88560.1 blast:AN1-type zinc finger protein 6 [Drosophila guanche]
MFVKTIRSHITAKPLEILKSSKARNRPKRYAAAFQDVSISDWMGVLGQPLESAHGPIHIDNSGTHQLCPCLQASEQQIRETQTTEQNGDTKTDATEEQKDMSTETPGENKKNRCHKCGKKLGLTGAFPCRCGGIYCAVHRYSDRHDCSFDYRELGANEIRRDNPVTVAKKLPDI